MARRGWKYIGFYGCQQRLVRVGTTKPAKSLGQHGLRQAPGEHQIINCPACGERHRTELMWRRPSHGEGQKEVDLRL